MTDEQINAAIAEACGWEETEPWINGDRCFARKDDPCGYRHWDIPNYCADLNAMHEAEKMLTENQDQMMGFWLSHICKLGTRWRATARERAEAFLRTLGKWEGD